MTTHRIERPQASLLAEVHGDPAAVPVLFVHGFPFDRRMWRHQVGGLARARRIAVDLRGAGDSRGTVTSLGDYADDLAAVLDYLEIPAAVVCGLSMGGYIAFDMLRRHAGRVRALVLADTRPDADSPEARKARDEMIALAEREGAGAVAERMLKRVLAPATLSKRPDVVAEVRRMMDGWSAPAMIAALRAMRERGDATALLPAVRLPALVVVGDADQVTPPAVARQMAGAIPGARLEVIRDAGHLAPLEQPASVTRALDAFLETLE